ncbi:MAG TPA: hypothetical protein VFQ41_22580 [Candidatus Angelobacter sp.]|nr:hypothetical protein [Candidatus Angelobacter sp.]
MKNEDDFFVGYLPTPPNVAKRMKRIVAALAISIVAIAATVGIAQHGFAHSRFEFGRYRAFEGVLLERPYPMLLVVRPGNTRRASPFSVYLLVDQFKHGADDRVRGLHGQRVSLEGELIYREGSSMLELKPGSIQKINPADSSAAPILMPFGPLTLTGEIVDSKCYLGVMNPGNGKVHRDCAARCVSGGVPAALVTSTKGQPGAVFLLQSAIGKLPQNIVEHAGEQLSLSGEGLAVGDQRFLILR